jgi:tRNA(adenine34) deaminase
LGGWSRLFWQRAVRPFGGAVARGGALDGDAASMDRTATETVDTRMMRRCFELSRAAGKAGELPFAAMICRDDVVISETTNQVTRDGDVTRHAEILAISQAQRATGNTNLQGCTLYTIVEPCPMCSFPVRETRISRVVYAISSPVMGGASRWNVLGDSDLSKRMPEAFGAPPHDLARVRCDGAARVCGEWNPSVWGGVGLGGGRVLQRCEITVFSTFGIVRERSGSGPQGEA